MRRVRERKGTNRCSFLLLSRNGGSEGTHTKKERRERRKQTNNTIQIPVVTPYFSFAFSHAVLLNSAEDFGSRVSNISKKNKKSKTFVNKKRPPSRTERERNTLLR